MFVAVEEIDHTSVETDNFLVDSKKRRFQLWAQRHRIFVESEP